MAEGIGEFFGDMGEIRAIMKEMEALRADVVEQSLRRVQEIMKRLSDQSEGGTADQFKEVINRMADAFFKLMDAVADFIQLVLDNVFKNEQADKDGADQIKTAKQMLYNI